ncbi:MAG: protein kinase, partial [Myxococcota bacterium]
MRDDYARGNKQTGTGGDGSPPRTGVVRTLPGESDTQLAFAAENTALEQTVAASAVAGENGTSNREQADRANLERAGSSTGDTNVDELGATAVSDAEKPIPTLAASGRSGDSFIGTTLLDRYRLTRKIGQGGMGAVYEAEHILIGKRVAVKVLLDKYADRQQLVARLEQEAKLASSIGHEHIIDITDSGKTEDGRTFMVMEYLEGQSLSQCLGHDGPLPERRIAHIAHQIAGALHAAHEKGIVHRDIKPENIFLLERSGNDFVKVVDFGISKVIGSDDEGDGSESPRLTQTGMVLGTPLYMSPEQARGDENLDRRIDVYSLGVLMYEMATGEVPFRGNNYLSIISQVLNQTVTAPREHREELSRGFEAVILRALEREPEDRYQSCAELVTDLALLLEASGTPTARNLLAVRPRRRSGLRMLAWVAMPLLMVSAIAVTVYILMGDTEPVSVAEPTLPGPPPPVAVVADTPVVAPAPAEVDTAPVAVVADTPVVAPAPAEVDTAPAVADIYIQSQPEGALIYLDERKAGEAPFTMAMARKNHWVKLTARLDGY